MGHPDVLQVGDVADRLSIANDDPVENLKLDNLVFLISVFQIIKENTEHQYVIDALA